MKIYFFTKTIIVLALLFFLFSTKTFAQSSNTNKSDTEKIIGADISFLPQLEDNGEKFSVDGKQEDAIQILKEKGFNWIRLRIFVNPAADSGYSPKKGYCDLANTEKMAMRIKAAHMKFLLDFHYSDFWADPGKQFKPAAWKDLSFVDLTKALHDYTKDVMLALLKQGTPPDMVQIGNEITHGMLWPDGNFSHPDSLAALLKAGIDAVKEVSPSTKIMLHLADGGENKESRNILNTLIARGVQFDVIGESYYPFWHGPIDSLKNNLNDLSLRYKQDVIVAEYSQRKQEVNDIAFSLPHGNMKGTFIWEPLNYGEFIFDKSGNSIDSLLNIYPAVAKKYGVK
jgi:arabinogalactan endo-1,4-beta-galactosidase